MEFAMCEGGGINNQRFKNLRVAAGELGGSKYAIRFGITGLANNPN